MKYLIIPLLAFALSSCSVFTEKAEWTDADYGGKDGRIAYTAYDKTHIPAGRLPHERAANKSCVDHTVIAAQEAKEANRNYKVVLFKKHDDLYHSAIILDTNEVIDIGSGQPIPLAEATHKYGKIFRTYEIDPNKIKPLFTALNGTFK